MNGILVQAHWVFDPGRTATRSCVVRASELGFVKMDSSHPMQSRITEEESTELAADKLIKATLEAVECGSLTPLMILLERLRRRILDPGQLELALQCNDLVRLTTSCFSSAYARVRQETLQIFLDALLKFEKSEFTGTDLQLVKILMEVIQSEVLNVAVRSDLFKQTFAALSEWCSFSKAHRDVFLEIFPIEQLIEYDVFHCPSDVLTSYIRLVGSVLDQGKHRSPLFLPVLKLFEKTLSCPGSSCRVAEDTSESICKALEDFEDENPVDELLNSHFIDAVVRHTVAQETCEKYCLGSSMSLIKKCLMFHRKNCQRLIDQGILNLMETCLNGNHHQAFELTCRVLENVFTVYLDQIDTALSVNLVGPLLLLREDPDEDVRSAARGALGRFFALATPQHVFAVFESGHLPLMVKLVRSKDESVQLDGLHWLFALVRAARSCPPEELSKFHQRMVELDVKTACRKLEKKEPTRISCLAKGLRRFVDRNFGE